MLVQVDLAKTVDLLLIKKSRIHLNYGVVHLNYLGDLIQKQNAHKSCRCNCEQCPEHGLVSIISLVVEGKLVA